MGNILYRREYPYLLTVLFTILGIQFNYFVREIIYSPIITYKLSETSQTKASLREIKASVYSASEFESSFSDDDLEVVGGNLVQDTPDYEDTTQINTQKLTYIIENISEIKFDTIEISFRFDQVNARDLAAEVDKFYGLPQIRPISPSSEGQPTPTLPNETYGKLVNFRIKNFQPNNQYKLSFHIHSKTGLYPNIFVDSAQKIKVIEVSTFNYIRILFIKYQLFWNAVIIIFWLFLILLYLYHLAKQEG